MPEDTEGAVAEVEMATWKSPDGDEIQVPADKLKGLEGLSERFSGLTTKEQRVAELEKKLGSLDPDEVKEKVRTEWLDGLTREELRELEATMFGDEGKPDDGSEKPEGESQADVDARLKAIEEKFTSELKARDERLANAELDREVSASIGDQAAENDEFSGLSSVARDRVLARALQSYEDDEWTGKDVESVAREVFESALKQETEYLNAELEHRLSVKKTGGPGAPGRSAGPTAKPPDTFLKEDGTFDQTASTADLAAMVAQKFAGG